jgi:hypothetical protein
VPPRGQYSNRGPQPLLLQRDQRQATQLQGILFREPAKPGDKRKSVFANKEADPKGLDDRQGPRLRHYVSEALLRGRHTIFGHVGPERDSRMYAREGPKLSMDVPSMEDSRRFSDVERTPEGTATCTGDLATCAEETTCRGLQTDIMITGSRDYLEARTLTMRRSRDSEDAVTWDSCKTGRNSVMRTRDDWKTSEGKGGGEKVDAEDQTNGRSDDEMA